MHLAHEEEKQRNNDQDGKAGNQQLSPDALLFWLVCNDLDIIFEQIIHQLVITDKRHDGPKLTVVRANTGNVDSGQLYRINATRAHFPDELRIVDILFPGFLIDIIEYRQQHTGNYHPEN